MSEKLTRAQYTCPNRPIFMGEVVKKQRSSFTNLHGLYFPEVAVDSISNQSTSIAVRYFPVANRSTISQSASRINLGDVYLNDLSILKELQVENLTAKPLKLHFQLVHRSPFSHNSTFCVQLANENLKVHNLREEAWFAPGYDLPVEQCYLEEGYNELLNHIDPIETLLLHPFQKQSFILSLRIKGDTDVHADPSDQALLELHHVFDGDEHFPSSELSYIKMNSKFTIETPKDAFTCNLLGSVCRSLFRVDVEEIRFDNCLPEGSYIKDFAVWNRSEIPLAIRMTCSAMEYPTTRDLFQITKDDTVESVLDTVSHVGAYGHIRIRVTYRPQKVGECHFAIVIRNIHDDRNCKTLRIYTCVSQKLHR